MSRPMLSQVQLGPFDTENHVRNKQFDAPGAQPSVKKKALADVKNTLHQKSAQRSTFLNRTFTKPSNLGGKKLFSNENEFGGIKDKQEKIFKGPNKTEILSQDLMKMENEQDSVETCKCDEISQDADSDWLFKDLKLTNSQIETFALNWENTPIVTSKDKKSLRYIEDLEKIELNSGHEDVFESFIETIPEMSAPELELPPLAFDHEMVMNGSVDCSIGL